MLDGISVIECKWGMASVQKKSINFMRLLELNNIIQICNIKDLWLLEIDKLGRSGEGNQLQALVLGAIA